MKHINIVFEDEEYKQIKADKGEHTWREYVLLLHKVLKETNKASV